MRIFDETKPFFKGNFHCHTTRSDGRLSPDEVRAFYRQQGYDFLVLSDHRSLSEQASFENGMLMLPGMEMDFTLPCEALHIVGFGMSASFAKSHGWQIGPQECINTMRRYGGRAILAHPHWSMNTLSTLSALQNVTAAEIYNTVSGTPWNAARADSSNILDVAANHGAVYNFVASDDSHQYNGEAGRSYTMVQADRLTQEAIIDAMDAGLFYSTQGPRFEQITLENGVLTVRCSPVSAIIFCSNRVWAADRCQTGSGLTSAAYNVAADADAYVRVQLIDAHGRSAWSNPVKLALEL